MTDVVGSPACAKGVVVEIVSSFHIRMKTLSGKAITVLVSETDFIYDVKSSIRLKPLQLILLKSFFASMFVCCCTI